eukprot:CAMPEP_0197292726 /NCGR_PEP_ID=MMETSP0890-20130614/24725_1 /TAXON_ID=44058 ORGANISM="Aureoumbra lagunensis, Strain CCMP1510" /NCGR_SAMPLE_ID=MMETSP0890 /ASSEMBLY_ACC=CAM_ASM_000533 /LENGTH=361 /DNA_ID=CAMNT_0042766861 /DNA_START=293 /DNA_END=1378 /DNA_ORIENTATION=-
MIQPQIKNLLYFVCVGLFILFHFVLRLYRDWYYRSRVVYVTTENEAAKIELQDKWNLTHAITSHLRWAVSYNDRQALTERLLAWRGFTYTISENEQLSSLDIVRKNTEITCGVLSGGQRHLIYLLRALAPIFIAGNRSRTNLFQPRVDILLLDEAFNCLDAQIRPRALRLVRYAITNFNVACVFVNQILHEVAVLCDDAIFLDNGSIVQPLMPAADMISSTLKTELHPRCREYISEYWALECDMRRAAGREDYNILRPCGSDLQDTMNDLPQLLFLGPPWQKAKLKKGDRVIVLGLQAQRRFNEKQATVIGPLDEYGDRLKVKLRDSQILSVRRSNLDLADKQQDKDREDKTGTSTPSSSK